MSVRSLPASVALLAMAFLAASDVDAQRWRSPPIYRPPIRSAPIYRPPPPRPMPPPRPVVRPTMPGGGIARPGPLIRAPIMPRGGLTGSSVARPGGIGVGRPGTAPRQIALTRPIGRGNAIRAQPLVLKPGANVSLKPAMPTKALLTRLRTTTAARPVVGAGANRTALTPAARNLAAIRARAAARPVASNIQALRAKLRRAGGPLSNTMCVAGSIVWLRRGQVLQCDKGRTSHRRLADGAKDCQP